MRRRDLLASSVATVALAGFGINPVFGAVRTINWSPLSKQLGNRLLDVRSPLEELQRRQADPAILFERLKNPYWIGDEPALTQTLGLIDGWTSRPSLKAVAAKSAADVAAAIRFAARYCVPLVVKGGGHSYFGNSNRAGSLLVWTRRLRKIEVHDRFQPLGAPADITVPAVSVGAGTLWGEVYRVVSRDHGRYVQGGGCLTVGTAGFVQGGGFGSFSKQFGTGAASLIEAEIVTADGRVRTVNQWRDPDLFYALRGGGGGTFGVVTRMTLQTHPLPETFGAVIFEASAEDETSWRMLVSRVMTFYRDALFRPEWGEQIRFSPGRRLSISMLCHSRTESDIWAIWTPLFDWIREQAPRIKIAGDPLVIALPGKRLWDPDFLRQMPGLTIADNRPGASTDNLFWASNLSEAGQILNAYQSRWIAASQLAGSQTALVDALVAASREWSVTLHTNKGLAGGSAEAIAATRATATNPTVVDAFALLICAADAPPAYPGIAGHEPDVAKGRKERDAVRRAMAPIVDLDQDAGSYVSEADYFGTGWQKAYWGENYPTLVAAKRRYDPDNFFEGHHTVMDAV